MLLDASIRFPNLGIEIERLSKGFNIFGISIAYYGLIIGIGMIIGFLLAEWQAVRTGQDKDIYLDFALYAIILSVIGARIFYVIFRWDEFKDNPVEIFDIRSGGLAIWGGIITAILVAWVYAKMKKLSFGLILDTGSVGLVAGQMIGRWGNFFNREVFGGYTDNLFAMQIRIEEVAYRDITPQLQEHIIKIGDSSYIQVHPTFLYESIWNLVVLVFLILYTKHKKFDGELILLYLVGYSLGRTWIEGIRTDQLYLWGTHIPIAQVISVLTIVVAGAMIIIKRNKLKRKTQE